MPDAAAFLRRTGDGGCEIRLRVVPGASRSEIVGPLGDRLKVRVASPAEGGKANRAVIALVSERLGVSLRDVEVVSGRSSRDKTLRVRADARLVEARLTGEAAERPP